MLQFFPYIIIQFYLKFFVYFIQFRGIIATFLTEFIHKCSYRFYSIGQKRLTQKERLRPLPNELRQILIGKK
jgi:hypothetical protein